MGKTKTNIALCLWNAVKRGHHAFWHWYKSLYRGHAWYVKLLVALASLFVFSIIYALMVNVNFLWLFGKSPKLSTIMHPKTNNASYVISADGVVLSKYYNENRTPVKFEEINKDFFRALIDTEDERFFKHHGVDFGGLVGAAKDFVLHGRARGASTITQQLVKNMFQVRSQYSNGLLGKIPGVGLLVMKSKEWIFATEIEMFNSKQDILTMYANTVDFGNNAFGIKTAARTYYNTTPDSLTVDQCATLVGLLKATYYYNPRSHPANSLKRRNVVLLNMVTHGDLAQDEYNRLKNQPTALQFNPEQPNEGQALYFRDAVYQEMKPWCDNNDVDFYTDGLRIYTTLDTRIQHYAEEAVLEQMEDVQQHFEHRWGSDPCWVDDNGVIPDFDRQVAMRSDTYQVLKARYPNNEDSVWHYMNQPHKVKLFQYVRQGGKVVPGYREVEMSSMDSTRFMLHYMHAGMVAMDPHTGFVKAWVGDVDYNTWKYDKVVAMRQPGSTFKLFVYSAAMERGLTPCDRRRDDYIKLDVFNEEKDSMEQYTPHNANGRFSGEDMTLREAFVRSVNAVAVRVGTELGVEDGPDEVAEVASKMGILSPLVPNKAKHAKPSLCLGGMDVTLKEMVNAYCTVANQGTYHNPILVTRITRLNASGEEEELYNYQDHIDQHQAISERSAFYMQRMLMAGLTDAGSTTQPLNQYIGQYAAGTDFGGKTGTTNNHSDAWFMGVTPNLVAGMWVGGEYRCIHFTSSQGSGGKSALPAVGLFFEKLWGDPALRAQLQGHFPMVGADESTWATCGQVEEIDETDTVTDAYTPSDSLMLNGEEPADEDANADGEGNNPAPVEPGGDEQHHQQAAPAPESDAESRTKSSFGGGASQPKHASKPSL